MIMTVEPGFGGQRFMADVRPQADRGGRPVRGARHGRARSMSTAVSVAIRRPWSVPGVPRCASSARLCSSAAGTPPMRSAGPGAGLGGRRSGPATTATPRRAPWATDVPGRHPRPALGCGCCCSGCRTRRCGSTTWSSGSIGGGLLVFVGVGHADTPETVRHDGRRTVELRIFRDDEGRTNRSLLMSRGRCWRSASSRSTPTLARAVGRHSWTRRPLTSARSCTEPTRMRVERSGVRVERGIFGAEMAVELVNDGPFTIWLDSAG